MILPGAQIIPPPDLTWTHLFPSSATFNGPYRPEQFRQRPTTPGAPAPTRVEVLGDNVDDILLHAKTSEGIVALNCRKFPKNQLRSDGYKYLRQFAVLPDLKSARWFVPLDSPAVSSAAMSMYTASTLSARLKREALRLAMQVRLPVWYKDQIWIAQTEVPPLEVAVNGLFPDQDVRWALSSGAPEGTRNRKASAVVMASDGTRLAFVKMAQSPVARSLMSHEAMVLKHLAGVPRAAGLAPRLLFSDEVDGVQVLAQSPLRGAPAPAGITSAHREFLARMRSPLIVRASETATAGALVDRFRSLPVSRPDLLSICQRVLPVLREFEVPLTIVHGDFTPWNLHLSDELVIAFDWEYGEPHGLPFLDEIHYNLQSGWLLHKWDPRQAVAWLQQFAWERPLGLDLRHTGAIAMVYLLETLGRLMTEGYEDQEQIIIWHREVLERFSSSSPRKEAAA